MQILLNIPEKKAAFFMEHLRQFSYVKATPMTEEKKSKPVAKKKRIRSQTLDKIVF